MSTTAPIVWFADIDTDSHSIGTHAKKLATLTQAKFPLAPGFLITSHAYADFLTENLLDHKIKQLLSTISFEHADSLMQGEFLIKQLFDKAQVSQEFASELLDFVEQLGDEIILSIHETGSQEKKHTIKHVNSSEDLFDAVINLWMEMFTGNALYRRNGYRLDHIQTPAEIIVQKKIHADTAGTITHEKNTLVIVTKHPHENDHYILSKKNLTIIDRSLKHHSHLPKLSEDEILTLAKMAKRVQKHLFFPQEISWVIDDNLVYITEIKPVTNFPKNQSQKQIKLPLARGKGVTSFIKTGIVHIIDTEADLGHISEHDIIVMSHPVVNDLKKLKKARGVIITFLPPTHFSTTLRQHYISALISPNQKMHPFRNGQVITIHGGKGEIYLGGMIT